MEGASVEDDAVGDAADLYDVVAASTLDLECAGPFEMQNNECDADGSGDPGRDTAGDAWVCADLGFNGAREGDKLVELRIHGCDSERLGDSRTRSKNSAVVRAWRNV